MRQLTGERTQERVVGSLSLSESRYRAQRSSVRRFPFCKAAHTATHGGVHNILIYMLGTAEQQHRRGAKAEVCFVLSPRAPATWCYNTAGEITPLRPVVLPASPTGLAWVHRQETFGAHQFSNFSQMMAIYSCVWLGYGYIQLRMTWVWLYTVAYDSITEEKTTNSDWSLH